MSKIDYMAPWPTSRRRPDLSMFHAESWDTLEEIQDDAGSMDSYQDQPPPIATNQVAAEIFGEAIRTHGMRNDQNRSIRPPTAFTAFGIGPGGVQANNTRHITSMPDVAFTDGQRRRVNLEVDEPGKILTHARGHLTAMREAVRRGHNPSAARSVFVTSDAQGHIQQIRHVHYELDPHTQSVRARTDSNVRLQVPLTAQQAWTRGLLQAPPQRRANRRQTSPAARSRAVPRRRGNQFLDLGVP